MGLLDVEGLEGFLMKDRIIGAKEEKYILTS